MNSMLATDDRHRELLFEGEEFGRRGDKKLVALTRCEIQLQNEENLLKCVEALRESDEALKRRPDEMKLWDWQSPIRDGDVISFGVAWYDLDFYRQKRDAFKDGLHARRYEEFGATVNDFTVTHFVLDD